MTSTRNSHRNATRHRERMRAAGLRPVQFRVPDTRTPEFAALTREQCRSLKGIPEEAEVLRITEEAASEIEGWEE